MILLDTQALVWAVQDSPRLGEGARELIASSVPRFVSAVSHAELTIKAMIGKFRLPDDLAVWLRRQGFDPLPLHDRHAAALRHFETLKRHDPFDRLLLAQAHVDRLTLVTSDPVLLAFDHTVDATR